MILNILLYREYTNITKNFNLLKRKIQIFNKCIEFYHWCKPCNPKRKFDKIQPASVTEKEVKSTDAIQRALLILRFTFLRNAPVRVAG